MVNFARWKGFWGVEWEGGIGDGRAVPIWDEDTDEGSVVMMSENLLQTLQQLVQDVIAPDVRELKVRVSSLEKQMDVRFDAVDGRFNALEQKMDAQFDALLAAIGESKAQSELTTMRLIAPLAERIAVLEAQRR